MEIGLLYIEKTSQVAIFAYGSSSAHHYCLRTRPTRYTPSLVEYTFDCHTGKGPNHKRDSISYLNEQVSVWKTFKLLIRWHQTSQITDKIVDYKSASS